ncbi:MAG: YjbQ family protein [Anaerolineales bacterium]|nr:YjbQ family protein [Anaerolineales bacterium]
METLTIRTRDTNEMLDITAEVQSRFVHMGLRDGALLVTVPHTTAGITINENADPAVQHDMLADLDRLIPRSQPYYRHGEGNSAAHMRASLMGASVLIPVEDGCLILGTWQGIYFCEFDGPRTRKVFLQALPG